MKFEQLISVLDVLTCVEVKKTGEGIIYRGKLIDIKPHQYIDWNAYQVLPCATSRETYLEIRIL